MKFKKNKNKNREWDNYDNSWTIVRIVEIKKIKITMLIVVKSQLPMLIVELSLE